MENKKNNNAEKQQNWFNIIWRHANQMTEPSKILLHKEDEEKSCAYRGENGNKCLIGILISDAEYHSSFEGMPCYKFRKILKTSCTENEEFLTACQRAHDNPSNLEIHEWKKIMLRALKLIALHYELTIPQE